MDEILTARGAKSSEFWLIIAFVVSVLANGSPFIDISSTDMSLLAIATFGYTGGRTMLKNTIAKKAPA